MEKAEIDNIEKQITRIRSMTFYIVLNVIFSFIGGMFIFYAFYHGPKENLHYVAVGGIWLVSGVAIYVSGFLSNHYKLIIKKLLNEIKYGISNEEK